MAVFEFDTGPDVENDDVVLADGTRLTDDVVDEIVEQVQRAAGRPSLTGGTTHSPHISYRVPVPVRDLAEQVATREGITVSALGRRALEEYLASH